MVERQLPKLHARVRFPSPAILPMKTSPERPSAGAAVECISYPYGQNQIRYRRLQTLDKATDYAGRIFENFDLRPFVEAVRTRSYYPSWRAALAKVRGLLAAMQPAAAEWHSEPPRLMRHVGSGTAQLLPPSAGTLLF